MTYSMVNLDMPYSEGPLSLGSSLAERHGQIFPCSFRRTGGELKPILRHTLNPSKPRAQEADFLQTAQVPWCGICLVGRCKGRKDANVG